MNFNNLHSLFYKQSKDGKPGLWANIHAKRKRGEPAAKPGDEDYPDSKNWKKVTSESEKKASPAWQRAEGKNPEGGLNEKGRASLKAEGKDIKRPQPEGGPRKDSFCARMKGMKSKLTSEETANDPDSRINKSLRKWKCGSDNNFLPRGIEMSEVKSASVALAEKLGTQAGLAIKQAGLQDYINAAKGYVGSAVGGLGSAAGGLAGDLGSQALSMYKGLDPTAQAALLGGGAGAAVGGIGNALFGKRKKGVGILGRLLRGSLAGGAIGGLGGAGINEAALRLGMRNSGADRDSQIYMSNAGINKEEAPKLPSQLANSYLGIQ